MSKTSETEERSESPPSPTLCSNSCGYFANPECSGMCSICFKTLLSEQKANQKESLEIRSKPQNPPEVPATPLPESKLEDSGESLPAKRTRTVRCGTCHKKLGLMGFPCRCGNQFCQTHRYPEEHQCPFDRKAAKRNKIKDENPVVLSDKIERV